MSSDPLIPVAGGAVAAPLEDPLYYLQNFRWLVNWVSTRYHDLLSADELEFVRQFHALETSSQGLFVRMVMRKGELFRADKLNYSELGSTEQLVAPLVQLGWVDTAPQLDLESIFGLFTWPELRVMLRDRLQQQGLFRSRKREALEALSVQGVAPATPAQWGVTDTAIYRFTQMPLCDRLRVMFFGNGYQDWSEFVLTELGTYQYETVAFSDSSRPFHTREEVDAYLQLQTCQEAYEAEGSLEQVVVSLPRLPSENPWLRRKYDKLLFKIARDWERQGELERAAALYRKSTHPGARARYLRVLELQGDFNGALKLAETALTTPQTEAERQQAQRCLPRIRRRLQLPPLPKPIPPETENIHLSLEPAASVELAVQSHLQATTSPVFYTENSLFNSLFGLLCWDAIFAPLPGAFFHPFQRAPTDLYWPDFYHRRKPLFDNCLSALDSNKYRDLIRGNYQRKQGRQSPFVAWSVLTPELLDLALACIPAGQLAVIFARMLKDLKANCAGFPDLIQFIPQQASYRLLEVKGPGDKLQDNQRRWLSVFADAQIPVAVCYVQWGAHKAATDEGAAIDESAVNSGIAAS